MSETTTSARTSAATPTRLALVSILLIGGAAASLTAAVIAVANTTRMVSPSLTKFSWFWIGGALTVAAMIAAVLALVAARQRQVSVSWPAASMGLVVLFVLVAGYVMTLPVTSTVVEGRPRRRRARGSRRRCRAGSPGADHGAMDGPSVTGGRERTRCDASTPLHAIAERTFLHEMWARMASDESESIATFLQLRAELAALDAPLALLERAGLAAEQEVGHARFALETAQRVRPPSAPAVDARIGSTTFREPERTCRTATGRRYRLLRLAVEAYLDGCCNEAAAAERLRWAASTSSAPLSAALTAIAREERSHVELAWSTIEWAAAEGGPMVAWTLLRRRPSRLEPGPIPPTDADRDVLRQWGWADPDVTTAAMVQAHDSARQRLLALSV